VQAAALRKQFDLTPQRPRPERNGRLVGCAEGRLGLGA
jgi:hypothetical protein